MCLLKHLTKLLPSRQYGKTILYFDNNEELVMLIAETDEDSGKYERFSYFIEDRDSEPRTKLVTELANGARVECPAALEETWVIPCLSKIPNVERISYANETVRKAAELMLTSIYMVKDYIRDESNEATDVTIENCVGEEFEVPFLQLGGAQNEISGHILGDAYRFCPLGIRTRNGTLFAELK